MACTLKELQDAEYEILCAFADFCDKYKIEYILSDGTLIGAIRHNDFIPWDDDIDVNMDSVNFKKFVKKIKKHPIPGFHFSWLNTDPQHPYHFAKFRKTGTFMPEELCKDLDINNGVWLDIFIYTGYPKNKILAKLQEKFYHYFAFLGRMYILGDIDRKNEEEYEYSKKYQFVENLPFKVNGIIRKICFSLFTTLGSKKSEYVVFTNWVNKPHPPVKRDEYVGISTHCFRERDFSIPANYDKILTRVYGDYMTPVEYHSHVDLSKVQL